MAITTRRRRRQAVILVLSLCLLFCPNSFAATYRVGLGEAYSKVSEVAGRLKAGDIVEITSDLSDSFLLDGKGTQEQPIVLRGIPKLEEGRVLRPQLTPITPEVSFIARISGDWIRLEGIAFRDFRGGEYGKGAIVCAGTNFALSNCLLQHNIRALAADPNAAGNILIEFCEFDSNGYGAMGSVSLSSLSPGATLRVEHCYFHSCVGNHLLQASYARNVIRYNWFEDPCHFALQISTPGLFAGQPDNPAADLLLPTHSDIVGNVFASGWMSNTYGALQIGGWGPEAPGTEGTFNIAHNLFIGRRYGRDIPFMPIVTQGNVDRINVFNNVIVDAGCGGCAVYGREETWDVPRTVAFKKKTGREEPIVDGNSNWISQSAWGTPDAFRKTILGTDPGFFSFVDYDFRPLPASPLAAKGLWPLPPGKIVSLVPGFEPQRGIPVDLKPRVRRQAEPPAIGPFEVAEERPAFQDDSAAIVLGVKDPSGTIAWQLGFARARRRALESLARGKPHEALQCARMQFILSPPDEKTTAKAVESVKQMLVAVDGNDVRAKLFDSYARFGPAGKDGLLGTADDLADPLKDVPLDVFKQPREFYEKFDRTMDDRSAMCVDGVYYAYWWEKNWFATEKALVRIEGGEFQEALDMLVPLLIQAVRKHTSHPASNLRTENMLARISEGLGAVARSRCSSVAPALEFVKNFVDYARYGAVGQDRVFGTSDDIDVRGLTRRGQFVVKRVPADTRLDALKIAHPGLPALNALVTRLESLEEARTRTVYEMEFAAYEVLTDRPSGFLSRWPTAAVFLAQLENRALRQPLDTGGLTPAESGIAHEAYRDAFLGADVSIVDVYSKLLSHGISRDALPNVRAFLTAYVAGVHNSETYGGALALLVAKLTGGEPPAFLVEDCCKALEEPLSAERFFDLLVADKERPLRREDRERLLELMEETHFAVIAGIDPKIQEMAADEAAGMYVYALRLCEEFPRRFPASRYTADIVFYRGFFEFRTGNYRQAVDNLDKFLAQSPESALVPNAMFTTGLSALALGETESAVETLMEVAQKFPASTVAPRALYAAGYALLQSGKAEAARPCLQRFLDFYADDPLAVKVRELLKGIAQKR